MAEAKIPRWTRGYWAGLHLLSAANLARVGYAAEQEMLAGNRTESTLLQHRACIIGSIFTSVAFLETTANEFFGDATDSPPTLTGLQRPVGVISGALSGLDEEAIRRVGNLWSLGVPRRASYSILEKFEIAVALADREPFDRGAKPYQEVKLLVMLRNEWIHYEPAWMAEHEERAPRGIETLEGHFPFAPRNKDIEKFSLHHCISHGCAEWGVLSAVEFADHFFRKMGVRPNFEHWRSKIVTR
jgi:hypothetical protein